MAATRVKFVYDNEAIFEECNGEQRPLTEAEYADNQYRGCPDHPRSGTIPDPSRPNTGFGLCALPQCRKALAPIPYAEYLAYYGNPEMHTYLGYVVQDQCTCCGEWKTTDSLWGIDVMVDAPELDAITFDTWISMRDALTLPGYLGDLMKDIQP